MLLVILFLVYTRIFFYYYWHNQKFTSLNCDIKNAFRCYFITLYIIPMNGTHVRIHSMHRTNKQCCSYYHIHFCMIFIFFFLFTPLHLKTFNISLSIAQSFSKIFLVLCPSIRKDIEKLALMDRSGSVSRAAVSSFFIKGIQHMPLLSLPAIVREFFEFWKLCDCAKFQRIPL